MKVLKEISKFKLKIFLTCSFFIAMCLILSILCFDYYTTGNFLEVINNLSNGEVIIKNINKENEVSKINIYYPYVGKSVIDGNINGIIEEYLKAFENEYNKEASVEYAKKNKIRYTLDINFSQYNYLGYTSFVLYITTSTLGFHPQIYIRTLNFDSNSKVIDIGKLVKQNPKLLNILSKYTKLKLIDKLGKNAQTFTYLLEQGTYPKEANFSNFVFTGEGVLIFFERYQIAPYALGEFEIVVPYDNLGLNI